MYPTIWCHSSRRRCLTCQWRPSSSFWLGVAPGKIKLIESGLSDAVEFGVMREAESDAGRGVVSGRAVPSSDSVMETRLFGMVPDGAPMGFTFDLELPVGFLALPFADFAWSVTLQRLG